MHVTSGTRSRKFNGGERANGQPKRRRVKQRYEKGIEEKLSGQCMKRSLLLVATCGTESLKQVLIVYKSKLALRPRYRGHSQITAGKICSCRKLVNAMKLCMAKY